MTTPVAPNREIIVRSFQPGCMRAAHKGWHAGRTEHAGFGDAAVAPNEVIGKSEPINQVWPGISRPRPGRSTSLPGDPSAPLPYFGRQISDGLSRGRKKGERP